MEGIDFLYKYLGAKLKHEFALEQPPTKAACACCGRSARYWPDKECVIASVYGKDEVHCLSCHSLYQPSFDSLGLNGYRGKTPTALILGMLKGCGALISPSKAVLYAPGKYYSKFTATRNSIFDEFVDLGGRQAVIHALSTVPSEPFLYIENFGVKKADLVKNLKVTDGNRFMNVCSQDGCYELPFIFLKLTEGLKELEPSTKKDWLHLLKLGSKKYLSVAEGARFAQVINNNNRIAEAMRGFPVDPHLRFKLASLAEV